MSIMVLMPNPDPVAACIIAYNPDITLLEKNLRAVLPQVDMLFLFDNDSRNNDNIRLLIQKFPKIEYFPSPENQGLPIHLNQALSLAKQAHCQWLLTLDQDSVADSNLVAHLLSVYRQLNDSTIGSISPKILYLGAPELQSQGNAPYEYISDCITSGDLINVDIALQVGGFDEAYFIDYVDYEFCMKLKEHGYSLIQDNQVFLHHKLDDAKAARFLWYTVPVYDKPLIRMYYISRNKTYYRITRVHGIFKRLKLWSWDWINTHMTYKCLPTKAKKKAFKKVYHQAVYDAKHNHMGKCRRELGQ
jgi:rhamnosyltransferase